MTRPYKEEDGPIRLGLSCDTVLGRASGLRVSAVRLAALGVLGSTIFRFSFSAMAMLLELSVQASAAPLQATYKSDVRLHDRSLQKWWTAVLRGQIHAWDPDRHLKLGGLRSRPQRRKIRPE